MINKKKSMKYLVILAGFLVILAGSAFYFYQSDNDKPSETPNLEEKLNFVVILTDDQPYHTLWAMPSVQKELIGKGVTFTNAFATTPLCCPFRASFLSGGFYPWETGVINNHLPNGAAPSFADEESLATLLQKEGYQTAMVGKYLNLYKELRPSIPPGWTKFVDVSEGLWSKGRTYEVLIGSSDSDSSSTGTITESSEYLTYFLRDKTLEFIDENADKPFFVYFAPRAPHAPAAPAPGDENLFSDYHYSVPSLNEEDNSDKPEYVRNKIEDLDDEGEDGKNVETREFQLNQLRSLQAVDLAVKEIVAKLEEKDLLDLTVIIFASDNGYMWGEHGLFTKAKPYEEAIKVPLVIRMPGIAKSTNNELLAVNLDVPTTILKLAGATKETSGLDLQPLLKKQDIDWRDGLAFQAWANSPEKSYKGIPDWAAWRTKEYKYVKYISGEKEFYDLTADPYELESQQDNPSFKVQIAEFERQLSSATGLDVIYERAETGKVGNEYEFKLEAWGGKPPYKWTLLENEEPDFKEKIGINCKNRLPLGLILTNEGVIKGVPSKKETCALVVSVQDSEVSRQTGKVQDYIFTLIIEIE